jgi:hypothetical protein
LPRDVQGLIFGSDNAEKILRTKKLVGVARWSLYYKQEAERPFISARGILAHLNPCQTPSMPDFGFLFFFYSLKKKIKPRIDQTKRISAFLSVIR